MKTVLAACRRKNFWAQTSPTCTNENSTLIQRIQKLEQNARHAEVKEQMLADFKTFCAEIKTNLDQTTPELQQEIIRLLMDHIVIKEDEIIIKHILPTDDDSRFCTIPCTTHPALHP